MINSMFFMLYRYRRPISVHIAIAWFVSVPGFTLTALLFLFALGIRHPLWVTDSSAVRRRLSTTEATSRNSRETSEVKFHWGNCISLVRLRGGVISRAFIPLVLGVFAGRYLAPLFGVCFGFLRGCVSEALIKGSATPGNLATPP